jgi:hypothetical protein
MGRVLVIAIGILGLVGWAFEIRREFIQDSGAAPSATVSTTGPGASRAETPVPSTVPTRKPTRPPGSTAIPTLSFSSDPTPRPTRTPP